MSRISRLENEVTALKEKLDEKLERDEISSAIRRGHVDWAIWDKLRSRDLHYGVLMVHDVMESAVEVIEEGTFTHKQVFDFFKRVSTR